MGTKGAATWPPPHLTPSTQCTKRSEALRALGKTTRHGYSIAVTEIRREEGSGDRGGRSWRSTLHSGEIWEIRWRQGRCGQPCPVSKTLAKIEVSMNNCCMLGWRDSHKSLTFQLRKTFTQSLLPISRIFFSMSASWGTSRYSYSLCTIARYTTARYSYSRYA